MAVGRVSSGARNHAAADDDLAPVEHNRLAGRDGVLGLVEQNLDLPGVRGHGARGHPRRAVPHARLDLERLRQRRAGSSRTT